MIGPEDLALLAPATAAGVSAYQACLDAADTDLLLQALRDYGGDKRRVARAMGVALSSLYER